MSDHYYTAKPTSEHRPRTFSASVSNHSLVFETDAGVFSRDELDFGSRLLIETAPPLFGRVLDMGCGWGAVGLFLKRLNPAIDLVMSDVNERALSLARKNAVINHIDADFIVSDGFKNVHGLFRSVYMNPPIRAGKAIIYRLFDESYQHLETGGILSIVIRKQQGAPSALKHFENTFNNADIVDKKGGYWIIRAEKGDV